MKLLKMRYITVLLAALFFASTSFAEGEGSKSSNKINWMTWDEVQVAMKKNPKKVWVDVYTGWCGWCKVMDRKTFSNPDVIKYMNENFYAVKFDAEGQDEILFLGKTYKFAPEHRAHMLAVQLMGGQMSYPTNIFMDEHFQNVVRVPGYQSVPNIQTIFTFLVSGTHKKNVTLDEYAKTFKPTWKEEAGKGNAAVGH